MSLIFLGRSSGGEVEVSGGLYALPRHQAVGFDNLHPDLEARTRRQHG